MRRRVPLATRFWSKVNKDGPIPEHCPELGPCWVWTGSHNRGGYGQIQGEDGRLVMATWVAKELCGISRPDKEEACHKCDTPCCVNPAHIFWGSRGDNMRDCSAKGRGSNQIHPERAPRGDAHPSRTHPERLCRGDRHWCAKLHDDSVVEIRWFVARKVPYSVIAGIYGVSAGTIKNAILGRTWKHTLPNCWAAQLPRNTTGGPVEVNA